MRLKTMSPKPLVIALHGASAPLPILAVLLRISRAGNISSSDDAAFSNRRSVWALHECPNGLIHQLRMGTHRVVAAVLDPHHGQIRRIRVETVELLRQGIGIAHPPDDQRRYLHLKRGGRGWRAKTGEEIGREIRRRLSGALPERGR